MSAERRFTKGGGGGRGGEAGNGGGGHWWNRGRQRRAEFIDLVRSENIQKRTGLIELR